MNEKRVIHSLDEIPQGMTEAEERAYWQHHRMGEGITFHPVPEGDPDLPPARASTLTDDLNLRFDKVTRERLEALARARGVPLRRLVKELVQRALEAEEALVKR